MKLFLAFVTAGTMFMLGMYAEKMKWIVVSTDELGLAVFLFPLISSFIAFAFTMFMYYKDTRVDRKKVKNE